MASTIRCLIATPELAGRDDGAAAAAQRLPRTQDGCAGRPQQSFTGFVANEAGHRLHDGTDRGGVLHLETLRRAGVVGLRRDCE